MSEPTFIDNLFAIQQAVREGKEWEYCGTNGQWFCSKDQRVDNLNSFVASTFKVRLKPEPPKPRAWDRESDVPFPCWIQGETLSGIISMLVIATTPMGVIVNDRSGTVMLFWGELTTQGRKHSTDRLTWKPCCTTEDQP